MLVIDGVELHAFDQSQQMGELYAHDAIGLEHRGKTTDEIVDVGHMGQHVVADDHVCREAPRHQIARGILPEKARLCRHADLPSGLGYVFGRLDPERRHACGDEVLEQIAVVAGHLDHLRGRVQPEAFARHFGEAPCMLHPAVAVGREIGVVAEDVLRRHEAVGLHQPAL